MTQDEIIEMAREADLICESRPVTAWLESTDLTPYLTRFAALVAAHEREACLACYSPDDTATDWADKIRARNG